MTTQLSIPRTGAAGSRLTTINLDSFPSRKDSLITLTNRSNEFCSIIRKRVPKDLSDKALSNEPFEDWPRIANAYYNCGAAGDDGDTAMGDIAQFYQTEASTFLRSAFNALTHIPEISFDISLFDQQKEGAAIDRAKNDYTQAGLEGQIQSLEEAYAGFGALRSVFAQTNAQQQYSLETVISSRYLPELLLAAPVWFIDSKEKANNSPESNPCITHFCNLVGTPEFARLFQMYNLEPRPIKGFAGRDVIPLPFAKLIEKTRKAFDFLVIATPYHDLASKTWAAQWQRNVDPFLFGFLKNVPEYMFFLGRWSGSGIFPGITEMMADTINHIKENQFLLAKFTAYTPWYMWSRTASGPTHSIRGVPTLSAWEMQQEAHANKHPLHQFASTFLKHYDAGKVFQFLRGELATA